MNKNKVQVVAATYQVNNDHDESRTHRISASVRIGANNTVESVDAGVVSELDGRQMASFNRYGTASDNLNVGFSCAQDKQCEVLDAINAFIADCEEGGVAE